ncbi:LCP family protein [Streptomyces vietnamensis]|uniref:Membrane protein n=1 Tax=Streptomyces vietnamensis TaxID=362257 RepID=A0A0B5HXM9_9ACTN|nr:LCP family protein [Streptomyces vietnamensis]AJF65161.1 membrane protein [Streptomyces vietnamensis]
MNDQQHPYDPYYPQPQIIGYDEYGQPVYQQPQAQQQAPAQHYDPYGGQQPQQQAYGYDPYAQQPPAQEPVQAPQYDPYGQQGYAYPSYDTGQQWAAQAEPVQAPAPVQAAPAAPAQPAAPVAAPAGVPGQRPASERPAPSRQDGDDRAYRTEQFSFIEEPDEDSEDVIDWLKFTESRSERREEARRRGRNRVVALVVVLVLAVVGGVGYLWSAGLLPGSSDPEQKGGNTATGPQQRDTIVVHLHDLKTGNTSTALLVDNTTTRQGTTVLIPNSVVVADAEGSGTTLGKSVEDDGSSGTREAIGNLLGAKIAGTWRLDTPYLENLVESVSSIEIDTDTDVPDTKKGAEPLVKRGEKQTLNGRAAVAYATYRGPGEAEAKQLQRFGQVLYGVLRKISSDPESATVTIETLQQILDPSLPEKDLGASLAKLAEHAKIGDYKTALLPVGQDGALTEGASDSVVKDILGGKVTAPEAGEVPRVSVRDGSGKKAAEAARVALINGGYAFVGGADAPAREKTQVLYGDDSQKATAAEVAKTLGLPAGSVEKGKPSGTIAVTVILGQDYKAPGAR